MENIAKYKSGYLKRLMNGLAPAEAYCEFCGQQKTEFLNPGSGRLTLLECECERRFKMLKEFLASNVEFLSANVKPPKTAQEESQLKFVQRAEREYYDMQDKRAENRDRDRQSRNMRLSA